MDDSFGDSSAESEGSLGNGPDLADGIELLRGFAVMGDLNEDRQFRGNVPVKVLENGGNGVGTEIGGEVVGRGSGEGVEGG